MLGSPTYIQLYIRELPMTFPQTLLDKAAAARADALARLPLQVACAHCKVLGTKIEPTYFDIAGEKTLGGVLMCAECGRETNFIPESKRIH